MAILRFAAQSGILLACLLLHSTQVQSVPYTLTSTWSGPTFFDNFNFITSDPSGGWVSYVDQSTAQSLGYAVASSSGVYVGVDHSSVLTSAAGRNSVRIESKTNYEQGLFIADFNHMPTGCGTWPAFWMLGGGDWPETGEVDILEGVNLNTKNQVSAHTSAGCTVSGIKSMAALGSSDCNAAGDVGCWYGAHRTTSYGPGFNAVGGGVYATQWQAGWISVWFWQRGTIPADIVNNNPNPATWGLPMAMFYGGCDIDDHFSNMRFVLNIDFCGAWSNALWSSGGCGQMAATCGDWVANNPGAFAEAYWHVNYISVFQPQDVAEEVDLSSNVTAAAPSSIEPAPKLATQLPANGMGNVEIVSPESAAAAAGFTIPVTTGSPRKTFVTSASTSSSLPTAGVTA